MSQVLQIANGDIINKKLEAKNSLVAKLIANKTPNEKVIEELYLAALARYPTLTEKTKILKALTEASEADYRAALEDVYWAVLSSKEFLFNH